MLGSRNPLVVCCTFAGLTPSKTQADIAALAAMARSVWDRDSFGLSRLDFTVTPFLTLAGSSPTFIDDATAHDLESRTQVAALAAGYDPAAHSHLCFVFDCRLSGQSGAPNWAWIPNDPHTWDSGRVSFFDLAHLTPERVIPWWAGRLFGLGLDGFLLCGTAPDNQDCLVGSVIPYFKDPSTYHRQCDGTTMPGDPNSRMGTGLGSGAVSPVLAERAGWVAPKRILSSGTYTLESWLDFPDCLKVDRYYLTYRPGLGIFFHLDAASGLTVPGHHEFEQHAEAIMLCMNPPTGTDWHIHETINPCTALPAIDVAALVQNAALKVGQTWTEPQRGIRFDFVSVGAAGAVVRITGDFQAPTVSITSPADGAHIQGGSVKVQVTASPDTVRIELWADGTLYGSVAQSKATITYRPNKGAHTLQAKAFDAAGNLGISSPVRVIRP